jgi:hypothetical protein
VTLDLRYQLQSNDAIFDVLDSKNDSSSVQGSPFPLIAIPKPDSSLSTTGTSTNTDTVIIHSVNGEVSNTRDDMIQLVRLAEVQQASSDLKDKELTKMEITRQRAELAFQRMRQKLRDENEEAKKKKAVKRTGGGFIIQYSKEI